MGLTRWALSFFSRLFVGMEDKFLPFAQSCQGSFRFITVYVIAPTLVATYGTGKLLAGRSHPVFAQKWIKEKDTLIYCQDCSRTLIRKSSYGVAVERE